jgi:hypothetical protein
MTGDDPTADLPQADRLSLLIGRAAQHHVHLDLVLRTVHQSLCAPGLGMYLNAKVDSTERLIQDCLAMISKADVPEEVRDSGKAALSEAGNANKARNRVVHDMWMTSTEPDAEKPYQLMKRQRSGLGTGFESTPADVEYAAEVVQQLRRATLRLASLNAALWETLPFFRDSNWKSDLAMHLKIMKGHFELTDDGGARLIDTAEGDQ